VLSQDVPSVRVYPQSAQSLEDISAARAASDVAELIEQNNHIEQLLTSIGYFLWADGKLGAYVRYVADGQRFGFHDENILEALEIPLGRDTYICPGCGKETASAEFVDEDEQPNGDGSESGDANNGDQRYPQSLNGKATSGIAGSLSDAGPVDTNQICSGFGAQLDEKDLRKAERISIPRVMETRRVPNGQEVISIAGGLELNTPVWANVAGLIWPGWRTPAPARREAPNLTTQVAYPQRNRQNTRESQFERKLLLTLRPISYIMLTKK
jgi:hypothetical protein